MTKPGAEWHCKCGYSNNTCVCTKCGAAEPTTTAPGVDKSVPDERLRHLADPKRGLDDPLDVGHYEMCMIAMETLALRSALTAAESRLAELEAQLQPEPQQIRCEHCVDGRWEVECCNGSSGCSCRGEVVDMGACRVCGGSGWRTEDADRTANLRSIQGLCYLGSGPR